MTSGWLGVSRAQATTPKLLLATSAEHHLHTLGTSTMLVTLIKLNVDLFDVISRVASLTGFKMVPSRLCDPSTPFCLHPP